MPTPTKYTYSIASDTANGAVNPTTLSSEVSASSIVIALDHIDTGGDVLDIWFKDVLTSGDQTTLTNVVAAHTGEPATIVSSDPVAVTLSEKKTTDGRVRIIAEKPNLSRVTMYTPNWCDKTTWYQSAEYVENETPTEPIGETYYQLANTYVIDTYHGKLTGEDFLKDDLGRGFRVAVTLEGVAKTEQDPHMGTGGDYTIDYVNGRITPLSWTRGSGTVLVTYHYAQGSRFIVKPSTGKRLRLQMAEAQFSDDIVLTDTAKFCVKGLASVFAPQLGLPEGTLISLGNPLVYKTIRDFLNDSARVYPSYPALSSSNWRGMSRPTYIFDWDYVSTTELISSYGMQIEISLEHDTEFGGTYATTTLYCTSEDE